MHRIPLLLVLICTALPPFASARAGGRLSKATPEKAVARLELLGLAPTGEALSRAIIARQRPLVDLLLAARVDVNSTDPEGRSPLLAATLAGDWELMTRLLADGAAPNHADQHQATPLMLAASHGHVPALQALIERGASLDAVDDAGHTALHYALAGRHLDATLHLLSLNPQLERTPADGRDALALAVETQDWRFIGPILERSPGGAPWNFYARSALAQALKDKNAAKVQLVLSKHSGPPTPEGCVQPMLTYAAAVNDLVLGRLLLDAGANPDTLVGSPVDAQFLEHIPHRFLRHYLADEPGMTTLMVAAGLGHTDFVRMLVDRGANRTQTTASKHRLVALYFAAWGEHAETIQVLLGNAPRPNEVRIEIDLSTQHATLYKDGAPVLSTEISSGRSGFATPTGRFVVTDKKQHHISSIYKVPMPYFMRLNCRDFGMHQGYVTGSPASHGCIRLPAAIARRLFKEVPIGTLVTISH